MRRTKSMFAVIAIVIMSMSAWRVSAGGNVYPERICSPAILCTFDEACGQLSCVAATVCPGLTEICWMDGNCRTYLLGSVCVTQGLIKTAAVVACSMVECERGFGQGVKCVGSWTGIPGGSVYVRACY